MSTKIDIRNVVLIIQRDLVENISEFKIREDGWIRRDWDNLGLLLRGLKVTSYVKRDGMFRVTGSYLPTGGVEDNGSHRKFAGYLRCENLAEAYAFLSYCYLNMELWIPSPDATPVLETEIPSCP